MKAIKVSCHQKTNRRIEFPLLLSPHSIYMIKKLRIAAKNNYETTYQRKLKGNKQNSFKMDTTISIDGLSPESARSCFKYLRSYSLIHLPNQMHWKLIKASTKILIGNRFSSYLSSVFQTCKATF